MAAREIWAKRVRQWVASGMTSAAFAASQGFNPRTLIFWKWRLAKELYKRLHHARVELPELRTIDARALAWILRGVESSRAGSLRG